MSSEQITGRLEDGGTYRATNYLVEISNAQGQVTATYDMNNIQGVQRYGQEVTINLIRGGSVRIVGATLDDAGHLETMIQHSLPEATPPAAAPPPPPPTTTQTVTVDGKSGGSSAGTIIIGGIVVIVVVVVIVAIYLAVRDDDDNSGGQPTNPATEEPTRAPEEPTATPEAAPTDTPDAAPTDTPSSSVDTQQAARFELIIAGERTGIFL